MEPGRWYNAQELARESANDPRELRYFRGAIGGRFREMNEDGMLTRRETNTRGVMFEYSLTELGIKTKKAGTK
jgi:hypothetical protein